ncbi:Kae1-like domain-containing protein [Rubeoparvulum massiliense]|uniref:Kae1-like domain-containing protein n=1 Tax=Rubeoparvulum massiliense TaxID=1631346 RepID=UPI00065E3341|nr:O-sialoglycoprotein endopeptidase [Rubeoparvulum massiliense]
MMEYILGVDTSNYRTSLCVINTEGQIVAEERPLLEVKRGERGLQQSTALFQHVQRLPQLMESIHRQQPGLKVGLQAIAVSTRPRNQAGSYMPVFRAGELVARSLSTVLELPLYETSHQEGHLAAGEHTADRPLTQERWLAIHLSGGTSELLMVERTKNGYEVQCLGGTTDLHAGQLVDRIGVRLGLPFPAGPELERLAQQGGVTTLSVPSSVKENQFSFSGAETALFRAIDRGEAPTAVARATEQVIANTLEKVLRKAMEQFSVKEVLIVGGVAANAYLRQRLRYRLEHPAVGGRLAFADPCYSGDNAFGVATIGLHSWQSEQ